MGQASRTQCITKVAFLAATAFCGGVALAGAPVGKEAPAFHLVKGKLHSTPIQVTVTMANVTFEHSTRQTSVGAMLRELGVPLSPKLAVRPALESPLHHKNKVVLPRLVREKMTFPTHLAAPVRTVRRVVGPEAKMADGYQEVLKEGREGQGDLVSIYYFQNDELLGYTEVTRVKHPPQEHLVVVYEKSNTQLAGDGVFFNTNFKARRKDPGMAIPEGAPPARFRHKLTMTATAYTSNDPGVGTRTAMGWRLRKGIVAVDPRRIPMGTRLYIKGYGYGVAADTGGAIKGNKIDLAFHTTRSAFQFGRRKVEVYVLD